MASGMEGLQLLQGWTTALWGEPIRLQNDLEATILWDAPTAAPAPTEDEMEALDLCRPAGAAGDQPRREKPEEMDSWDTGELPGTDTEEEAWGLTRIRRRSAATAADTPTQRTTIVRHDRRLPQRQVKLQKQ